ncbi:MAG: META domain-containing protein [Melioribacteraceae bacterium]|nr:META domain-containing protein [Melioribacteraceae bacterium]
MKLFFFKMILILTTISCTSVKIETEEQNLKGTYSYMADAAIFIDCKTDKKYPVAFEGENIELESAYLEVQKNPGEQILVTLSGHFEMRPRMEGGGEREFLIIDKFDRIWPHINCVRNLGTANLQNTFWSLYEVANISISTLGFEKHPNFIIKQDNEVKGFGGCNNFFGSSTSNSDSLNFSNLGVTRKMCEKHIDVESKFIDALEKTNKYKIYGEFLYLYNNEELLAILESVYFN